MIKHDQSEVIVPELLPQQHFEQEAADAWSHRLDAWEFPMGQSYLVETGQLKRPDYIESERLINNACITVMQAVLKELGADSNSAGSILHIGLGAGGDVGYWKVAREHHFQVSFVDHCDRAFRNLPEMPGLDTRFFLGDALDAVEDQYSSLGRNSVVYISRVLHHLSPKKAEDLCFFLGRWLGQEEMNRRLLLNHPCPEDNPDTELVNTETSRKTCISKAQVQQLLSQGAGREVPLNTQLEVTLYRNTDNPKTYRLLQGR